MDAGVHWIIDPTPSVISRIRWDSEDPVGFRGSGGIPRIRWDPDDPVGSRGSGGIQRIRWDPEDPVGSRGSDGIQRIRWDPEYPGDPEDPEDHGIQRIRWDPMGPVGSIPPLQIKNIEDPMRLDIYILLSFTIGSDWIMDPMPHFTERSRIASTPMCSQSIATKLW